MGRAFQAENEVWLRHGGGRAAVPGKEHHRRVEV
jgi:hypothetical protein